MVCLLKNKRNKQLLEQYKSILGSEDAAYYVLAANNGYPLTEDPLGNSSKLYEALLADTQDPNEAIRLKSAVFSPQFTQKHGEWFENYKLEPVISDLDGDYNNSLTVDLLNNKTLLNRLKILRKSNDTQTRGQVIKDFINDTRTEYVQRLLSEYLDLNKNATKLDIYGFTLAAKIDWSKDKLDSIVGDLQSKLASAFGLKKTKDANGKTIYKTANDSQNKLIVNFVESISTGARGLFREGSVTEEAAWNAILISLENGDPTTFVHEMLHYYIRTYWDSEPIQEALREIGQTVEDKSSKAVEEALVTYLTEKITPENHSKFFSKLLTLLHSFTKSLSKEQKQDARDALSAMFLINEDLSQYKAEELYYEKYIGVVEQSALTPSANEPETINGSTYFKIKQTLEARVKSEKSRNAKDALALLNVQQTLEKIKAKDYTNQHAAQESVVEFLLLGAQDIQSAESYLLNIAGNPADIRNIDVNEFMHVKSDILGYYGNMYNKVVGDFLRKSTTIPDNIRTLLNQQMDNQLQKVNALQNKFDVLLGEYIDVVIDDYVDENVAVGDRDRFKANAKLWARNQINHGSLPAYENFVGPAVSSESPVVRIVDSIIRAQNRATYTAALEVSHDLLDKYKKCANIGKKLLSINFMRNFCELDEDGNPTGYFVRKYNMGSFHKKIDDITRGLIKKYKLEIDNETGEIIFPDKYTYIKYSTDYYTEVDKIANLRYNKDYYITRSKILSPKTVLAVELILRQIRILEQKAYDEEIGMPLLTNLTSIERQQLNDLRKEKETLTNPYIILKDTNGNIISLEEKTGEQLLMAKELILWNKAKAMHLKYKSNWSKFNLVRDKLVQRYGENSPQLKRFDYAYKGRNISEAFWEELGILQNDDPKTIELSYRRSVIVNSIKAKKGYYQANLKRLNDQAFEELKRIDEQLGKHSGGKAKRKFSELAQKAWVMEYDDTGALTDRPVFDYFSDLEQAQRQAGNLLTESKYTYVDSRGETVPLTVFKYTAPLNPSYIEESLSGLFSEVDPFSEWANWQFDELLDENIQPKDLSRYESSAYKKIQSDDRLRDFYNTLLDTMAKAYSMLPNMDPEKMKYVMPQMRDRDAKLLFRNRHLLNNIGASVADAFSITETNTAYNEEYSTRPDGTRVQTIPIRWVTRLEDPSIISTDLVRSVAMFYEMALNYQNKADINPLLLAILFLVAGGFTGEQGSIQMSRIDTMLDMYVYGRTRAGFKTNRPMSKTEIRTSRIVDTVLAKAHHKLMNHNWRAILKNFVDSFLTETGEVFCGKYITVRDAVWANAEMAKEIFSTTNSFGRGNTKSKIAALMLLNQVSGSIAEQFGQHNETWLRRILSKHFAMGEYTLVDYTFKGHLTASVYHSFRLVEDPETHKLVFMSKDQAQFKYYSAGLTSKEGLKRWKKSKTTLFDVYNIDKKGNAVLDLDYIDAVMPINPSTGKRSSRILNNVTGILHERSAIINGILDESDKSGLQLNMLGVMLLLMRGWMISQMVDNFKTGHDYGQYVEEWRIAKQSQSFNYAQLRTSVAKRKIEDKRAVLNPVTQEYEFMSKQQAENIYFKAGLRKKDGRNAFDNSTAKQTNDDNSMLLVNEDPEFLGQYNFATGTIEDGQWRHFGTASKHYLVDTIQRLALAYKHIRRVQSNGDYVKKMTINERYKLRRLTNMCATFIGICLLTFITGMLAQDYDDWYTQLGYAVNISVISERASQIPVLSWLAALDIVNTAIISKTLIDDADKFVDLAQDIVDLCKDKLYDDDDVLYNTKITSGTYNGLQKWQRDVLKTSSYVAPNWTPDNIYRSTSKAGNKSSYNYYLHNVAPTKQAVGAVNVFVPWAAGAIGINTEDWNTNQLQRSSGSRGSSRGSSRGGSRSSSR